jgi:hypothetical protein
MTRLMRRGRLPLAILAVWLTIKAPVATEPLLIGCIDVPAQSAVVSRWGFYAAGWIFRSDNGAFPDAVAVGFFNRDTQQWFHPDWWQVNGGVYRPDVRAAFAGALPALGDYAGYFIYTVPPPPGNWDMVISWATYDGGTWNDWRHLTFVD